MAGTKKKRRFPVSGRSKKRFPLFWILYGIFVIAMVIFWIKAVSYVKKCLVRYEDSQPKNAMDAILADFKQRGLNDYMTIEGEISRFETEQQYANEFQGRLQGKILFYGKASGFQDPAAPRYELFANGDPVGYVTLKEASSESVFLNLLTISEWALDKVEIPSIKGNKSFQVTVPDSCKVMVNGILADERELTGDEEVPLEFSYSAAYVEVPRFVSYQADGLLDTPTIEVLDENGTRLPCEAEEKGDVTTLSLKSFNESEMPEDLAAMALENAERYTNFFSADLKGSKASTSPIRDMFPADSYYLELADTYRREDMWMYSDHSTPVFKNESVSHYVRYQEDFFSCEVYFEKEMKLTKTGKVKVDVTNFRLYYGLLDGEWKILDMVTLLTGEE